MFLTATNIKIRINGRAPAWPVLLEEEHPFYNFQYPDELGSASYSILGYDSSDESRSVWELLIDAGHNTVPFLLKHDNRIPDAILLTHAHPDHILGVDWIVQSWYRKNSKAYPVYCSMEVFRMFMHQYPHLEGNIQHTELIPGKPIIIPEVVDLKVTAFPVFHGSGAKGASMLLVEQLSTMRSVLFTGDMLCPLLRKKDIPIISNAGRLFIDTNNRYPDPESNHISFARRLPEALDDPDRLKNWFSTKHLNDLLVPHRNSSSKQYMEEFSDDWHTLNELPHTTVDFLSGMPVPQVYLMHYWGWYDQKHYGERLLDEAELENWADETASYSGLKGIKFYVPKVGEFIDL